MQGWQARMRRSFNCRDSEEKVSPNEDQPYGGVNW